MKIDADKVTKLVSDAVAMAREYPEQEASSIVNDLIASAAPDLDPANVQHAKQAEDYLSASARKLDEMGESSDSPLIGAIIGLGFGILAIREDAESYMAGEAGA